MTLSFLRNSGRILSVVPLFLAIVQPASAQEKAEPKEALRAIRVSPEQIPTVPGPLLVFRLSAQKPPMEFVQEALRRADPEAKKLAPLSEIPQLFAKGEKPPEEIVGAMSDGHLAAYVDLKTGDAEIFASFTRQKPVPGERESVQMERAESLASPGRFLGGPASCRRTQRNSGSRSLGRFMAKPRNEAKPERR
jgi:hypothetical protein